MRAFVHSIEDGIVRVLLGGDESVVVNLPAEWLPEGIREGQVLRVTWEADEKETEAARKSVDDLYAQLGDNP